jgi:ATP-dependent DNA helicase RecG
MKESQITEWKESWRDEYVKWICGFANAEGGKLVIGRNDKGDVIGLKDPRQLLEVLPNKVRDILGVMVDVNLRKKTGLEYLEIVTPAYPNAISHKGDYYYRSGSTNQLLKGASLERFLMRKHGRTWDSAPLPYVTLKQLSQPALATFRKQALQSGRLSSDILKEPDGALLDKLRLREGKYLTRAAILLFHPLPEELIGGAYIKLGYFDNNVDLRFQDVMSGSLFAQVSGAIEVLRLKYMKAWITYSGLQRIETYPVPEAALREAVLNAAVHKDYASSVPVQISVYADKLMIWNPGQLPTNWTVERLLAKHPSEPFNPQVAGTFFRAGVIESWGRGVERIVAACRSEGRPDPEFQMEATGVWVIFHFGEPPITTPETTLETEKTTLETEKTTLETRKLAGQIVREQLITILRQWPALRPKDLSDRLELTADGVKYHLNKLRSAGVIQHVGSRKSGHWEILK